MSVSTAAARSNRNREALFGEFRSVIASNPRFDRRLVSFQANRTRGFYSWLKYKEGFSADLVEGLLDETGKERGTFLDPFAGVGTSLFAARARGWDAVGVELLPVGFFAIQTRLAVDGLDVAALRRKVVEVEQRDWEDDFNTDYTLAHIPITQGAFPRRTERQIAGYRAYVDRRIRNGHVRQVFQLAALAVLEAVSYTRKDGQYLRWDQRARKPRVTASFDKGEIPDFNRAVREKLWQIVTDLERRDRPQDVLFEHVAEKMGAVDARLGSCLEILPELPDRSIDLVVTSPPYCNRYDYTRTYALELVYLGMDKDQVNRLRQAMLSCTVENREKTAQLHGIYARHGRLKSFDRVMAAFRGQAALHEVLDHLDDAGRRGEINNVNIPRMVRNYFLEMCFVVHELARLLRPGGCVVMVNDNVRYIGEEVPVDLILSAFARGFGLHVEHIWTLPRGKGNSSQQMGAHGRTELRKCVYVWRKPA